MEADEDQEYIYPYWDQIFEVSKFKGRHLYFDLLPILTEIPVDETTAKYLRLFESSTGSTYQAICGRFYEALFQQQKNFANFASVANRSQLNTLEGAPFDGFIERRTLHRRETTWSSPFKWLTLITDNKRMIPWEMKKKSKDGYCKFSARNIAAIRQLGGGMLIGATILDDKPVVQYRVMIDGVNLIPTKPPNIPQPRNHNMILRNTVNTVIGGAGLANDGLQRGLNKSDLDL